jgi:hypothetical protein
MKNLSFKFEDQHTFLAVKTSENGFCNDEIIDFSSKTFIKLSDLFIPKSMSLKISLRKNGEFYINDFGFDLKADTFTLEQKDFLNEDLTFNPIEFKQRIESRIVDFEQTNAGILSKFGEAIKEYLPIISYIAFVEFDPIFFSENIIKCKEFTVGQVRHINLIEKANKFLYLSGEDGSSPMSMYLSFSEDDWSINMTHYWSLYSSDLEESNKLENIIKNLAKDFDASELESDIIYNRETMHLRS